MTVEVRHEAQIGCPICGKQEGAGHAACDTYANAPLRSHAELYGKLGAMVYGDAEVEVVERKDATFPGTKLEPLAGFPGLVWMRRRVFSFNPHRGGYVMDFKGGGGSGYYPAGNVRNFRRLDDGIPTHGCECGGFGCGNCRD